MRDWRKSGHSAAAYCESRGLNVNTLRQWSSRFKKEEEAGSAQVVRLAAVRLVESSDQVRPSAASLALAVGGVRVEVRSDFDAELLDRVLDVLERRGGAR